MKRSKITFPSAARRMDTLNDLLAASDLVSLHCALTNETIQILNAECLQHIKPGTCFVLDILLEFLCSELFRGLLCYNNIVFHSCSFLLKGHFL